MRKTDKVNWICAGVAWNSRTISGKEGRYKSVAKPDKGTNAKAAMEAALRLDILMCFIYKNRKCNKDTIGKIK
jgi:hypothetical protein